MPFIIIILFILTIAYFVWIGVFCYGWIKLPSFKSINQTEFIRVSVIVPVRCEEDKLTVLLKALLNQEYPNEYYEIIVVNDHSTDSTAKIAGKYCNKYNNIALVNLPPHKTGKKWAINAGVTNAQHPLVITTDADCAMGPYWLREFSAFYSLYKPALIAGPVLFTEENSLLEKFLQLELISLVSTSAGAINANLPVMCSGANLAFEKNAYLKVSENLQWCSPSGDDVFLLHALAGYGSRGINFLKSRDAIVYTSSEKTIKGFLNQRVRWASKSRYYKQFSPLFTAFLVLSVNLALTVLVFFGIFNPQLFKYFAALTVIKSAIDFTLLFSATKFFGKKKIMWYFIPSQILYIFYVASVFIFAFLPFYGWKNRTHKI